MSDFTALDIYLYEQKIGSLIHLPGDKNLFVFDEQYRGNSQRPTLSLSFKDRDGQLITDQQHTRTRIPPFFSNLLPEGHMRGYLASLAQINPQREFYLLAALGEDLSGAIKAFPSDQKNLKDKTLEALDHLDQEENLWHFSLAGVQLKFSAIWETHGGLTIPAHGVGGDWIVKLPSSIYPDVPENEYAMMELARQVGIEVPETALISMDQITGIPKALGVLSNHAFAIKRFDRDASGQRIHIEDFAQVFGVFPEKKYRSASYRNIAEVIWSEMGQEGLVEFIRRFVFNTLIGNGDMHLKNWSLIYPDRRFPKLAPAYDFVSTIPYLPEDKLALTFVDSKAFNDLTYEQFKRFAMKVQIPEALVLETVIETTKRFSQAWKNIKDFHLSTTIIDFIDNHLKIIPFWIEM